MMLTFDRAGVEKILDALRTGTAPFQLTYGQTERKPQLWLIGDDGVYLMANNTPDGEKPFIVYANECNPTAMSFNDWWSAKQQSYGGDDGCDPIEMHEIADALATYKKGQDLEIDVSPGTMAITYFASTGGTPPPLPDGYDRILADLVNQYIVVTTEGTYSVLRAGRNKLLIGLFKAKGDDTTEMPIDPFYIPVPIKLGAFYHLGTHRWARRSGPADPRTRRKRTKGRGRS
jgi:hypothetical protein